MFSCDIVMHICSFCADLETFHAGLIFAALKIEEDLNKTEEDLK
jgi:hypothetical protein